MRENIIQVSSFSFIDFLQVDIEKRVGEHSTATIVGTISDENGDDYVEKHQAGDGVCITAFDFEGNSKVLLSGIIDTISVKDVNRLKTLTLTIVSPSFQMDIVKHTRTFQDENMSYADVVDRIRNNSNLGNILISEHSQTAIGSMLVQYEETDWQFCKRIASRLNTYVVTDNILGNPYISIGIPKNNSFEINPVEYSICKNNAKYLDNSQHNVSGYSEKDAIYYEVVSREIHDICSSTVFKEHQVYVYAISSKLIGATLQHTYTLKAKTGFRCKEHFNKQIIGASLTGIVKEIEMDKVRVEVHGDVLQKKHKWFLYATVYSSPDNTGWYFMPEVGDEIRLHFPTEHESVAYVISSVHEGSRDDKDIKSIRTKWGKAIVFAPNSILITNGTGSSIKLDDEDGIAIVSTKQVNITADDNIQIASQGKIVISGDKGIVAQQTDNQININKNIDISAGHVRIR